MHHIYNCTQFIYILGNYIQSAYHVWTWCIHMYARSAKIIICYQFLEDVMMCSCTYVCAARKGPFIKIEIYLMDYVCIYIYMCDMLIYALSVTSWFSRMFLNVGRWQIPVKFILYCIPSNSDHWYLNNQPLKAGLLILTHSIMIFTAKAGNLLRTTYLRLGHIFGRLGV